MHAFIRIKASPTHSLHLWTRSHGDGQWERCPNVRESVLEGVGFLTITPPIKTVPVAGGGLMWKQVNLESMPGGTRDTTKKHSSLKNCFLDCFLVMSPPVIESRLPGFLMTNRLCGDQLKFN